MPISFIRRYSEVSLQDVSEVGGKNASLGEMIRELIPKGINLPGGYIVTASAYRYFLEKTSLKEFITGNLKSLNTHNLKQLSETAQKIREQIKKTPFPSGLEEEIKTAQKQAEKEFGKEASFAVRSSATAEDLPGASFAGEHETFLNISGLENILEAVKSCMASLFTDRAISYRVDKGFDHFKVALSVGVQKMVRSDLSSSGVMFTLDTETGFKDIIIINGVFGLGEMIVQGQLTPDEFLIFKPTLNKKNPRHFFSKTFKPLISKKLGKKFKKMVYSGQLTKPTEIIESTKTEQLSYCLNDDEVLRLAGWGKIIEDHYSKKYGKWTPMDIEWAKDGKSGKLFIVQARPETIHAERDMSIVKEYKRLQTSTQLVTGASVGNKIASGKVRIILDTSGIKQFRKGEILVTEVTDPDWEPIMKIASGIITDKGGRTSHAAIVSRELGIPCIVGTEKATRFLKNNQEVTIDTTSTEGVVFAGRLNFKVLEHDTKRLPQTKTKIMLNIATPDSAFEKSFLPNSGVGLAREEFIIASEIGIHPNALIDYLKLNPELKHQIDLKTEGFTDKKNYYIKRLASGIAKIAAAFYPKPVIVRFSDFKSNEYRSLLGGDLYEPQEENPMIGWRGASRYYSKNFLQAFNLELEAVDIVRDNFGLTNLVLMVPFVRTLEEAKRVRSIISNSVLGRDKNLKIYMMCELPSNVLLAEQFLEFFDGMSIGSNDLTQLTLGLDRDGNETIRNIGNENNPAVKELIRQVIKICKKNNKYIGICGQGPSDYSEFAKFLTEEGIDSISLNPDSIIHSIYTIHKAEKG